MITVVGAGTWHVLRQGWRSSSFQTCLLILAYLAVCYVASFGHVCMHPYWEDNGVEEFIPMKERWVWAIVGANFLQIILSPGLWAMSWVVSTVRSRRQRGLGSSNPLLTKKTYGR